jgi:hypothetical protein
LVYWSVVNQVEGECWLTSGQINGWAADKYGPKIVMMISTVALAGFIFLSVFGMSISQWLMTTTDIQRKILVSWQDKER